VGSYAGLVCSALRKKFDKDEGQSSILAICDFPVLRQQLFVHISIDSDRFALLSISVLVFVMG
jgi:hypothetical protein